MSAPSPPLEDSLDTRQERFESAWRERRAGDPLPCWPDYLPPVGQRCTAEFVIFLLDTDIEFRIKSGLAALLSEPYFEHPRLREQALLTDADKAELVRWEYQLRWNNGTRARRVDYCARFPDLAEVLKDLRPRWNCPQCKRKGIALDDETATAATCPWCQATHPVSSLFPLPAEQSAIAVPGDRSSPSWGDCEPPGYETLEELGRGGMGVVYKARQIKANRTVALKMILAGGHASPEQLRRFQAEAEALARLQHPGIVQVFEVDEHRGLPYFSLEFCSGGSLNRKLAGTPLQAREAATLVEQLARAVHAAHSAGVIHRDLKPANVLLGGDGTPKIGDFGLARRTTEGGQTASGTVRGTASYMPPEQALDASKVDARADVYALGAIRYESLTGKPPFRGASWQDTIQQVLEQEPVRPTSLNAQVPPDPEAICLRCLEKDARKRYATALELAGDLERYLRGEPVRARRGQRVGAWLEVGQAASGGGGVGRGDDGVCAAAGRVAGGTVLSRPGAGATGAGGVSRSQPRRKRSDAGRKRRRRGEKPMWPSVKKRNSAARRTGSATVPSGWSTPVGSRRPITPTSAET